MKLPFCSKWRIHSLWCFWFVSIGGDPVTADPVLVWTSLLSVSTVWRPCNHWEGLRAHHINYKQLEKCDLDSMLREQTIRANQDLLVLPSQGMVDGKRQTVLSYFFLGRRKAAFWSQLITYLLFWVLWCCTEVPADIFKTGYLLLRYHGCPIFLFMYFHEFSFI